MSYSKINWQNLPSTATPVNATNLNKMDNGIADANNSIGVDAYDNTSTYAVGDYCIYNNTLYRCKTAIATAEAFNSSKWDQTSINYTQKKVDIMNVAITSNFENKSIPSGITTNVGTIQVKANEVYLLIPTVGFPNNSTGFRQVGIATNATTANKDRHSICRVPAVSGAETNVQVDNVVSPNVNTTYYINVYQNSGSSLNVVSGLIAIRLR